MFGFLGPNGAGKTITIRLMLDLIRPTSGRMTVSLAVGAGSGRRAWATAATAAVAVASPFYHYAVSDPLRTGLEPAHVLALAGMAALAALAALVVVERRDLAT